MSIDVILGAAAGIAVCLAIYIFLQKRKTDVFLEKKLREIFPGVLKDANEQLISMANEKLGAEKNEIKTDLENKRAAIERMILQVERNLTDSGKTSQSILQQIKSQQEQTEKLGKATENLRKVLTNNQMRGQFGEQVAGDLLRMTGFVRGTDFKYNKATGQGKERPDFTIFLPDRTKVNVDVKFPYKRLQEATETEDEQTKERLLKSFEQDVKEKIRQMTTREYINPEDRTVDFVILFIPNEMVFSYIYERLNEVWNDAMQKKVVLAGPFSFTAILRMIRQAYDNFRYQENIQEIVGLIRQFEKQFDLYNQEFNKLGSQLQTVTNTYNSVEMTRTRQLTRVVEKIKLESGADNGNKISHLEDGADVGNKISHPESGADDRSQTSLLENDSIHDVTEKPTQP